jgi:hypothetical protein
MANTTTPARHPLVRCDVCSATAPGIEALCTRCGYRARVCDADGGVHGAMRRLVRHSCSKPDPTIH